MRICLVTGCEKTGTSLVGGLCDANGLFGGDRERYIRPVKYNRRGNFENRRIKEEILKPYLTPRGLYSVREAPSSMKGEDVDWFGMDIDPDELRSKILNIFRDEGWDGEAPLFIKQPCFVRMPKEMSLAFPEALWMLVRRDPQMAMWSRHYRNFTNNQPKEDGTFDVDDILRLASSSMDQIVENCNTVEVWPEDIAKGLWTPIRSCIEYAGGKWDQKASEKFYDPTAFHLKQNEMKKVVTKKPSVRRPLFTTCIFDTDIKITCDKQIAIASYGRSGSHCIADWVCSQFAGQVRYTSGLNLTSRRRNNPKLFHLGDLRLPTADQTGTDGKKTLVVSLERFNPEDDIMIPWIGSDTNVSIIIVRNPYNWLASIRSHGTGSFRSKGLPSLLRMWSAYAAAALGRKDCIFIYYDKFISCKSYRDSIADKIGVDRRSDDSLSRVCSIGRGSSFDGVMFDGRASEMNTDSRWEAYKDEKWMIDAMNNVQVSHLLGEIESFVLT